MVVDTVTRHGIECILGCVPRLVTNVPCSLLITNNRYITDRPQFHVTVHIVPIQILGRAKQWIPAVSLSFNNSVTGGQLAGGHKCPMSVVTSHHRPGHSPDMPHINSFIML